MSPAVPPSAPPPSGPPPGGGAEFVGATGIQFRLGQDLVNVIDTATRRLGSVGIRQALLPIFHIEAQRIAGVITQSLNAGKKGLYVRTGNLKRSIIGRGELIDGAPAMRVGVFSGPSLRYAGVQEHGTKGKNPLSPYPTIRPKRGKALAIPVGPALNASGVPRFVSARQYRSPRGGKIGADSLRFVPINRGRLLGVLIDPSYDAAEELSKRRDRFEARKKKSPKAFVVPGVLPENAFGDNNFRPPEVADEDGTIAYILMRAVDIRPKFFLRDGFTNELPNFSRRLALKVSKLIAPKKGES